MKTQIGVEFRHASQSISISFRAMHLRPSIVGDGRRSPAMSQRHNSHVTRLNSSSCIARKLSGLVGTARAAPQERVEIGKKIENEPRATTLPERPDLLGAPAFERAYRNTKIRRRFAWR
jgi:hypothetical protein